MLRSVMSGPPALAGGARAARPVPSGCVQMILQRVEARLELPEGLAVELPMAEPDAVERVDDLAGDLGHGLAPSPRPERNLEARTANSCWVSAELRLRSS